MHVMYDSVDLSQVPKDPHAVAYYINGHEGVHTEEEVRSMFPHARLLGISVTGIVPAQCYDIERGDYTPDQVPDLYRCAVQHGIWRPCFYAQLSGVMPAVKEALNTVVNDRKDVRTWVAYYDGRPNNPLDTHDDAHQFTDKALGRNLDESVCVDTFFQPASHHSPAPSPKPVSDYLAAAKVTFDPDQGTWTINGIPAEHRPETA